MGKDRVPEMTDNIVLTESEPVIIVDNSRLASIDLLPDYFAVLYSDCDYQGKSIRVYADETLQSLDRIGSIKIHKKRKGDYELITVFGFE